jgi:hypothetical protein
MACMPDSTGCSTKKKIRETPNADGVNRRFPSSLLTLKSILQKFTTLADSQKVVDGLVKVTPQSDQIQQLDLFRNLSF